MHEYQPVANGLRTDHPVPGLPFVDDTLLPLDDPHAIEAIGRKENHGTWGRCDKAGTGPWRKSDQDYGWLAFTTDPMRQDLAWCVRNHSEHGRTVLIYRDDDASGVHMDWWGDPLLFRSGGYWWDGKTWYRPGQVWDAASEQYDRRGVPAATTVTAADLLDDSADPDKGQVLKIANLEIDTPSSSSRWLDDLALWATRRDQREEQRPLSRCVVKLSAPELGGDQLVGIPAMAEEGGISASTLRAYISRNEGDVPPPQATVNGRSMWARPVAKEWAEQRNRSPESVAATVTTNETAFGSSMPVGVAGLHRRFARTFFSLLWESPDRRKRWALRHRTEDAVRQVADELAWEVAAAPDKVVPIDDLTVTIRHAVLDELARSQWLHQQTDGDDTDPVFHGITPQVARMLDWLVRHQPSRAQHMLGELIGDAERGLDISREVTGYSLRVALTDGELDDTTREEFLDRVLPPTPSRARQAGSHLRTVQ